MMQVEHFITQSLVLFFCIGHLDKEIRNSSLVVSTDDHINLFKNRKHTKKISLKYPVFVFFRQKKIMNHLFFTILLLWADTCTITIDLSCGKGYEMRQFTSFVCFLLVFFFKIK